MSLVDILGAPVDDSGALEPVAQHTCRAPAPIDPVAEAKSDKSSKLWIASGLILALVVGAIAGWRGAGFVTGPPTAGAPALPAEIAGYAELYIARELSAPADGGEQAIWVNQTAAVHGEQVDEHTWLVTVAVDSLELVDSVYVPAELQHFTVLVTSVGSSPTAIGLPSRVPIATVPDRTASLFPDPVPDDQAVAAVAFVEEYLTGGDELSRYLATPSSVARFENTPYESATVRPAGANSLGKIRADVTATKSNGISHQLEYVVTMVLADGVWVVADVAPAAA